MLLRFSRGAASLECRRRVAAALPRPGTATSWLGFRVNAPSELSGFISGGVGVREFSVNTSSIEGAIKSVANAIANATESNINDETSASGSAVEGGNQRIFSTARTGIGNAAERPNLRPNGSTTNYSRNNSNYTSSKYSNSSSSGGGGNNVNSNSSDRFKRNNTSSGSNHGAEFGSNKVWRSPNDNSNSSSNSNRNVQIDLPSDSKGEIISFNLDSIVTSTQALDALEYYSQRGDVDSVIKLFGANIFENNTEALTRCIATMEHMGLYDELVKLVIEQEKLNRLLTQEIWDTIISSVSKATLSDETVSLYKSYLARGFRFSESQMINIGRCINAHSPIRLMLDFINLLFEMNHILPNHILHHLIFICSLKKQNDLAVHFVELMNDMRGKDLTVHALDECLSACQSVGDHNGCLRIIKLMNQRGIKRHASWITACMAIGDYDGAVAAIQDAHNIGANPGENMYFSLVEKLNSVGRIDDIERVIQRLICNNSKVASSNVTKDQMVIWSRAIELWRYIGRNEKVENIIFQMINFGFDPSILNFKQQLGLSQLHLKNETSVDEALRERHAKGDFKSLSRLCAAILCCSESSNYKLARFLFDKNIGHIKEKLFADYPNCNSNGAIDLFKLPPAHMNLLLRALGEMHFICRKQRVPDDEHKQRLEKRNRGIKVSANNLVEASIADLGTHLADKSVQAVLFHADLVRRITYRDHTDSGSNYTYMNLNSPLSENKYVKSINNPKFPLVIHYNMILGYFSHHQMSNKVLEVFNTLLKAPTTSPADDSTLLPLLQPNYRSFTVYLNTSKEQGASNKVLETASEYAVKILQAWKTSKATPVEYTGHIALLTAGLDILSNTLANVTVDKKNVDDITLRFEMLLVIIKAVHTLGFPTKCSSIDLVVEVCNKLLSFPGKHANFDVFYSRAYNLISSAIIDGQPFSYEQIRTFMKFVIESGDHAKVCELFELNPTRLLYSIVTNHNLLVSILHSLSHQKRHEVIVQTISNIAKQRNAFSSDCFNDKRLWEYYISSWCRVLKSATDSKDDQTIAFLHDSFSMLRKCADAHNVFSNLELMLHIANWTLDESIPDATVDILEDILKAREAELKRCQMNLNTARSAEVTRRFSDFEVQIKSTCSKLEDLFLKQVRVRPESGEKAFIDVLDRYDSIKERLSKLA